MSAENAKKALTTALQAGFVKEIRPEPRNRSGFMVSSSVYAPPGTNVRVVDQYYFPGERGAGQEIARADDEETTRVYCGGILPEEELTALGITKNSRDGILKKDPY